MKKSSTIILALLFAVVFSLPVFAQAATSPGIKPGSFFYFFDAAFEKVGLFFAFSPEKKAQKALQYADERLAEAEAVAENAEGVKTAIANYESNIALAAEKSKDIGKERAEALLTAIAENTSKHQGILADVLAKVPDEAKEAIIKAIEASRKEQEEATKQIVELKGEVEKLKQEVAELKATDEERKKMIEELNKQKTEKPVAQQKISAPTSVAPIHKPEQMQTPPKTSIITLPSGSVVEMDADGKIIRYVKEIITNIAPTPPIQSEILEITSVSVNVPPEQTSAKIEWQTNKPAESKVFVSGGNLTSKKVFSSESGLSTRHMSTIVGLSRGFKFSYEIEAIAGGISVAKKTGSFETEAPVAAKLAINREIRNDGEMIRFANDNFRLINQGARCGTEYFSAEVLDQYGDTMVNQEVTIETPTGSLVKITKKDGTAYVGRHGTGFWYTPSSTSTTEIITFTSGNLSVSGKLYVQNWIQEIINADKIQLREGVWWIKDYMPFDPETKMCIEIIPPFLR